MDRSRLARRLRRRLPPSLRPGVGVDAAPAAALAEVTVFRQPVGQGVAAPRRIVKDGDTAWQTMRVISVQGLPVTFTVSGCRCIAVTTGLGGGSPRNVPPTITPDVKHPQNGNALYVFALSP